MESQGLLQARLAGAKNGEQNLRFELRDIEHRFVWKAPWEPAIQILFPLFGSFPKALF